MTKELKDIILAKCDEREARGYDYLTDSDILDILLECEKKNIRVIYSEIAALWQDSDDVGEPADLSGDAIQGIRMTRYESDDGTGLFRLLDLLGTCDLERNDAEDLQNITKKFEECLPTPDISWNKNMQCWFTPPGAFRFRDELATFEDLFARYIEDAGLGTLNIRQEMPEGNVVYRDEWQVVVESTNCQYIPGVEPNIKTDDTKYVSRRVTAYPYATTSGEIDVPEGLTEEAEYTYIMNHFDDIKFGEPDLDFAGTEFHIDR